ncbi:glycoside hydrolase family 75 protein [Pseudobacteroides cellulosolvens]|uniref:Chitosanase n=1 Tax=Pseudobacteroides cellulosolvens ATCC 35603 = DSM 2933 TaxID=398512 RepID=A0A0L6JQE7_9FIRM|nr:glycoside hydrolase family 75 protein [Pseudobacteroides cellulosolvens]KNY28061.1 chitosanase [Pseudobacteroides cellulosolvens ATCC 35603 = DSM 2933]
MNIQVDMKHIANYVMNHAKNYPNEVYWANVVDRPSERVYLKTYSYGPDYTPATVWKTSAQVDTDGSPINYPPPHDPNTSLMYGDQAVNAETIPYIVLPKNNKNNVMLGDIGIVIDTTTGKSVYVIYADKGPAGKIGEASIAMHAALGFQYKTSSGKFIGHDDLDLVYIMFPGSGSKCGYGYGKPIPTAAQIANCAIPYFNALKKTTSHSS